MRAETALACALLAVLVTAVPAVAGPATAPVTGAATGDRPAAVDPGEPAADSPPATPDESRTVTLDVQLHESGNASWTVRTYVPLEGENETRAFRDLGRRFETGTADVDFDVDLFRRVVAAANDATGRSMAIPADSVRREWVIRNGTGVLRLQFNWTGFATEEDDRLVVDDAFDTASGTWLPRLERGQELVIRPPDGFAVVDAPKGPRNATLRWVGPREFPDDYFRIVYRSDEEEVTPTRTPTPTPRTPTPTPRSPTPTEPGDLGGAMLLGLVLIGGGLAVYALRRRLGGGLGVPSSRDGGPPARDGVAGDSAGGAGEATTASGSADDEPGPDDPFAGVDVEMLSDEERVLRLLDANGGRMKQARIVKETDWSNAKVSQLLSSMDEDGEIDKLRIGRENLISLPDVDVDDFGE